MIYDLHINSMTYTLFFIPDYQFQKGIYVSLGNNFLLFLWRPLSCGGLWATAQFAPPLKSGPDYISVAFFTARRCDSVTSYVTAVYPSVRRSHANANNAHGNQRSRN